MNEFEETHVLTLAGIKNGKVFTKAILTDRQKDRQTDRLIDRHVLLQMCDDAHKKNVSETFLNHLREF